MVCCGADSAPSPHFPALLWRISPFPPISYFGGEFLNSWNWYIDWEQAQNEDGQKLETYVGLYVKQKYIKKSGNFYPKAVGK